VGKAVLRSPSRNYHCQKTSRISPAARPRRSKAPSRHSQPKAQLWAAFVVRISTPQRIRMVDLKDDLLEEADAIAEFIFGARERRRAVYHLADKGALPVFRMGKKRCARKSSITAWIAAQEAQAAEQEATR
jgi:hypothetical protein